MVDIHVVPKFPSISAILPYAPDRSISAIFIYSFIVVFQIVNMALNISIDNFTYSAEVDLHICTICGFAAGTTFPKFLRHIRRHSTIAHGRAEQIWKQLELRKTSLFRPHPLRHLYLSSVSLGLSVKLPQIHTLPLRDVFACELCPVISASVNVMKQHCISIHGTANNQRFSAARGQTLWARRNNRAYWIVESNPNESTTLSSTITSTAIAAVRASIPVVDSNSHASCRTKGDFVRMSKLDLQLSDLGMELEEAWLLTNCQVRCSVVDDGDILPNWMKCCIIEMVKIFFRVGRTLRSDAMLVGRRSTILHAISPPGNSSKTKRFDWVEEATEEGSYTRACARLISAAVRSQYLMQNSIEGRTHLPLSKEMQYCTGDLMERMYNYNQRKEGRDVSHSEIPPPDSVGKKSASELCDYNECQLRGHETSNFQNRNINEWEDSDDYDSDDLDVDPRAGNGDEGEVVDLQKNGRNFQSSHRRRQNDCMCASQIFHNSISRKYCRKYNIDNIFSSCIPRLFGICEEWSFLSARKWEADLTHSCWFTLWVCCC